MMKLLPLFHYSIFTSQESPLKKGLFCCPRKFFTFVFYMLYYGYTNKNTQRRYRAMTLKQFINEAMDMAQVLLAKGDHIGYSKVMAVIADAIYEAQEA